MRSSKQVFTSAERRFAMIAAAVVIAVTTLLVVTGGLFNPSLGSAARRGIADLPDVADATPLG